MAAAARVDVTVASILQRLYAAAARGLGAADPRARNRRTGDRRSPRPGGGRQPTALRTRRARKRPAASRPARRGSGRRSRWRSALAARSRRRTTSRTAVGRAREHQEVRHREVVLAVPVAPDQVGVAGESGTGGDRIRGVAWVELCDGRGSLPDGGPLPFEWLAMTTTGGG